MYLKKWMIHEISNNDVLRTWKLATILHMPGTVVHIGGHIGHSTGTNQRN